MFCLKYWLYRLDFQTYDKYTYVGRITNPQHFLIVVLEKDSTSELNRIPYQQKPILGEIN
jgi:hypothetical protein